MKFYFVLLTALLFGQHLCGQVIIESNTLPKVGDELNYTAFENFEDTLSYKTTGENVTWNIGDLEATESITEEYSDIAGTPLETAFPDANIVLDFGGFEAVGRRQSNSLEVLGISTSGFGGFGLDSLVEFDDPFVLRRTPFAFGDSYSDDFAVEFIIDSEELPFLDSLDLSGAGLPGELAGIRITTTTDKTEEAVGWGTLNLYNNSYDVLQVKQTDVNSVVIEIGFSVFGFPVWFDLSEFGALGGMGGMGGPGLDFGDGSDTEVTYRFLSPDSKESIIEFTEIRFQDTLGTDFVLVEGLVSGDILSNLEDPTFEEAGYNLYPNPTSDFVVLNNNLHNTYSTDISVYNMNGAKVMQISDYVLGDRIYTTELLSGQYILKASDRDHSYYSRFSVIK